MKTINFLFVILFSLAVAACGGGGGGGSSTTAAPTYSISGTVTGTTGVTITVTGGTANTGATTDASDNYTVTGLNDGHYTVTPSKTGYTFTPVSTPVIMAGTNVPGKNFAVVKNAVLANISGTVTGPWVDGVTITISGDAKGTATTDAGGNYPFGLLPSGASYTFTPTLAGYTFTPASRTIAVPASNPAAVTVPNMEAAPAIASYSISGTVTTTKTGPIGIRVIPCDGCSSVAGTAIAAAGLYTVRGLQPGNYWVVAEMDALGTARLNASNPISPLTPVTISASNLTGVDVTVVDPPVPTPLTPVLLQVAPGNGSAFVMYSPPKDAIGQEIATKYRIYWSSTDPAVPVGSSSFKEFAAQGDRINFTNFYVLSDPTLTNGVAFNFKMTALVGTTESKIPTPVVLGPVTIGDSTAGTNTVSGAVTFPVAFTGPMIVGLYSSTTGVYFTRIPSPASPQIYSIAGVSDGSYFPFAVIDTNDNGVIDSGEISNVNAIGGLITVAGANITGNDIALSLASATASVNSDHWYDGSTRYSLILGVNDGTKRAVAVTLVSGPNVAVPLDMGANRVISLGATIPKIGDSYMFKVTFSDGNTENISGSVTGVLDSFAQTLAATGGAIPIFSWAAPSPLPSTSYIYRLTLWGVNDSTSWRYPQDFGLPSTTLSALYNVDGKASSSSPVPGYSDSLKSGNLYNWQVQVRDASGNSASFQTSYTP